jgi:membrane-bound lytic murein transglycosylase D
MRASHRARFAFVGLALTGSIAGCAPAARRPAPDKTLFAHRPARRLSVAPSKSIEQPKPATETALGLPSPHPEVRGFINAYQTNLRGFFDGALTRGSRYMSTIGSILAEEGVPPELAYVPIVESGFRLHAVSPAGAVGPWQFIHATGRRYGLRIDGYVDERRDPEKATRAAARYLRDLYNMFGDWHLSLAAYNTGEGRISRILEREKVDGYWEMTEGGHLSRETSEYVPRILAAMEIATAPREYGFEVARHEAHGFDLVHVDRSVSLDAMARLCGTNGAQLRELNPALSRGVVPPRGYTIRVPKGTAGRFRTALAKIPRYNTHQVRRGETVSKIAGRYGVSANALMAENGIRDPRRLAVGKVLRIPVPVSGPGRSRVASRRPAHRGS